MLTGDKLETAKCIAISTGFKAINQIFFEIQEIDDDEIEKKILEFSPSRSILIVTGTSLDVIMKNQYLTEMFFEKA